MDELIELNAKLKQCFNYILSAWLVIKKQNNEEITLTKEEVNKYFSNTNYRTYIMTEGIEYLHNNGIDISEKYNLYFYLEKQIIKITNKLQTKINEYELSIKKLGNQEYNLSDFQNLYECLRNAYNNYENNLYSKEFYFYSSDMNESIHKGMNTSLSINKNQVIHLLGISNENNQNSILGRIYQNYSKTYNDISYIDFVLNYSEKYVTTLIFKNKDNLSKEELEIIKNINITEKQLCDELNKIFIKSLNFRKVYEYKLIPEIVLDYKANKENFPVALDKTNIPYSFATTSEALTPIDESKTLTLLELKENIDKYDSEEQEIIKIITERFKNPGQILIEKKLGKNNKQKREDFKILDLSDKTQYKFSVNNKTILSDLPVNLFLLSYNKELLETELIQSKILILKSVLIMCQIAMKELNINLKKIGTKTKKEIEICEEGINYILSEQFSNVTSEKAQKFKEVEQKIDMIISKYSIYDLTRDKLVNISFLTQMAREMIELTEEDIQNYKQYMDHTEYEKLKIVIKSMFSKELLSRTFFNNFGLFKAEQDLAYEQPKISSFMQLAEYLREQEMKKLGIYTENNKSVSAIGFAIKREEGSERTDGIVTDCYPKTFMGKTGLQTILDMRLNGRNYFLDSIYDENNYYYIVPLIKYYKFLKIINYQKNYEKQYKNENNYNYNNYYDYEKNLDDTETYDEEKNDDIIKPKNK